MIEQMMHERLQVTVLFYNPNIHPKEEYDLRKDENKRYASVLGVPFVDLDYDVDAWLRRAKGMEFMPERGARCTMCFDMRFERTALYAHENGFDVITTTNATSRWKDAQQVNSSGIRAASKYGVRWWQRDWQTDAMSDRKYRINAEHRFYKQEFCGCKYSLRDTNAYRAQEGLAPVEIAGGKVYSDPEADSCEESREIVAEFFSHTLSPEQERLRELREVYRQRRKTPTDESERNNW
jgi:predicted adenine nucleotide alpha hydrolase (AANH) superfamily ATPase